MPPPPPTPPIPPTADATDQPRVWFYVSAGAPAGPMTLAGLEQAIRAGAVRAETLVWRDGMSAWAPAGSLVECRSALGASPPVTPGPLGPPPGTTPTYDTTTKMLLPVGRSPYAIVAGYLGLFSVLLIPAPFAVLFGILAIRDIRRNPEKSGMGRASFGLALGGLGTIGLVFMIAAMIGGR